MRVGQRVNHGCTHSCLINRSLIWVFQHKERLVYSTSYDYRHWTSAADQLSTTSGTVKCAKCTVTHQYFTDAWINRNMKSTHEYLPIVLHYYVWFIHFRDVGYRKFNFFNANLETVCPPCAILKPPKQHFRRRHSLSKWQKSLPKSLNFVNKNIYLKG